MLAPDPEAAYYQAVEEYFVARRGDPLFLSNGDWLLVHRWREGGVPLRIVLRGIRDALDGHAHSWGRRRKVGSLAYCEGEVEAARDRWQRAVAYGLEDERPVAHALRDLAETLEVARGLGPRARAEAAALAADLRARAETRGDGSELERWLAGREQRFFDILLAELAAERRRAIAGEIGAVLAPYRERMPARVMARLEHDSLARRVLAEHGLPRLTLFPLT
jgi:hypothetical protein